MAGASLLTLLDDIASVLDDVALMTKVAAKKTAGVLGDDLALNAQQVSGVRADRELPVVWAVALGSLRNKLILVPAALLISAVAPWAITPLLMLGGAFLCFEGFEKVAHKFFHNQEQQQDARQQRLEAVANSEIDLVSYEKSKINGAIRTDFILSAEIIAITLGTVAGANFTQQLIVLTGIALVMTIGVYGVVAAIVKLDDLGLYLSRLKSQNLFFELLRRLGKRLVLAAPYLMKALTVIGTVAMFMVGGGILTHGVHDLHVWLTQLAEQLAGGNTLLAAALPSLFNVLLGVVAGAVVLAVVSLGKRIWQALRPSQPEA